MTFRYVTSQPVPVHRVPPGRTKKRSEWQDIPLHVPDVEEKTPVPPPRRRKKRKINSLEVLNSQLDKVRFNNTPITINHSCFFARSMNPVTIYGLSMISHFSAMPLQQTMRRLTANHLVLQNRPTAAKESASRELRKSWTRRPSISKRKHFNTFH